MVKLGTLEKVAVTSVAILVTLSFEIPPGYPQVALILSMTLLTILTDVEAYGELNGKSNDLPHRMRILGPVVLASLGYGSYILSILAGNSQLQVFFLYLFFIGIALDFVAYLRSGKITLRKILGAGNV